MQAEETMRMAAESYEEIFPCKRLYIESSDVALKDLRVGGV
jgi:hypothetical protein